MTVLVHHVRHGDSTVNGIIIIIKILSERFRGPTAEWYYDGHLSSQMSTFSPSPFSYSFKSEVVVRQLVVSFQDLKFGLSSQLKAASCAWCSSEMPPSKQVNGHSFTICLMVWCSFLSVTHGYMAWPVLHAVHTYE